MPLQIEAAITWIQSGFGGRRVLPAVGLRSSLRFQRHVAASSGPWEVQVVQLDIDAHTWRGIAQLAFASGAAPDLDHVKPGEPIELLDTYRVIGVGMILSVEQKT